MAGMKNKLAEIFNNRNNLLSLRHLFQWNTTVCFPLFRILPKTRKVVMESVDEKTSTAIAKDHFFHRPCPSPREVDRTEQDETLESDQNEGWDNDLHVDSHDFEEQVPESEQQSPPETVQDIL